MREINHHLRLIFPLHILENGNVYVFIAHLLNFNGMNKQTDSFYYSKMLTRESRQITSLQITFRQLCPLSEV